MRYEDQGFLPNGCTVAKHTVKALILLTASHYGISTAQTLGWFLQVYVATIK